MEEEEEKPKGRNLLKLVREAAVFYTTIFFSLAAIFRYFLSSIGEKVRFFKVL